MKLAPTPLTDAMLARLTVYEHDATDDGLIELARTMERQAARWKQLYLFASRASGFVHSCAPVQSVFPSDLSSVSDAVLGDEGDSIFSALPKAKP